MRDLVRADLAASDQSWRQALRRLPQLEPFWLVVLHRSAHALQEARVPGLPRMLQALGIALWSADISPEARIGAGLRIVHSVGVVIGPATIGTGARIFQNVTIGRGGRDHGLPTLGDAVTLYAGAVVSGGIALGDRAVVAANALVRSDVPAGHTAAGNPATVTPTRSH